MCTQTVTHVQCGADNKITRYGAVAMGPGRQLQLCLDGGKVEKLRES